MNLIPLSHYLVLRLDPDISPSALIARPDMDTIKFCKRCGNMMEALAETKCRKRLVWERDKQGVPIARTFDQEHELDSVRAPANPSKTRTGEIVALHSVAELSLGERVLIHFASGRKVDEWAELFGEAEYRVVHEDAVLGLVEA